MIHTDQFGQAFSCASVAAANAYTCGIDRLLSYQADALSEIDRAIELDAEFALAHIARARICQIQGRIPEAREAAAQARLLANNRSAREQQHVSTLALAVESKAAAAFAQLQEHTRSYPRDALPLSLALGAIGLFAFSGRPDSRERELAYLQSLASHWQEHWWFDTYLGWALIETGAHRKGIERVERALRARPENAQAAHALAHGHYECGQAGTGLQHIEQWVQAHGSSSVLYAHLRWHQGLFALQTGDTENARNIYRESIAPDASQAVPLMILMDAASFAWRSVIYGRPLDATQLESVAAQARDCLPGNGPAFFLWHKALAFASAGDHTGLSQLITELQNLETADRLPPGDGLVRFAQGLAAYARQDYPGAVQALTAANASAGRIGGSSAQQDIVADSLIAATVQAGEAEAAEQLAAARATRRASHLNTEWTNRIAQAFNA